MSTKVKIDKDNTGYETIIIVKNQSSDLFGFFLNSDLYGEKIIVQIGPNRVSRTFVQESQNEIDNF